MSRIVSLDIGSKSCGVAICDALQITTKGLANLNFNEFDWQSMINQLKIIFKEYKIKMIIVGLPTLKSGTKTQTTIMIEKAALKLYKAFPRYEIHLWDENFSTKKANALMQKSKLNENDQKKYKDMYSAIIILQDYLDTIYNSK